ncbi:MAG: DNA polymerase Y family protein [Acetobacteraceae bacterium]|nr:DNA polymerase Y family protein [Acetobacteraceae bacterium]
MPRVVSLYLPTWPTDRWRRHQAAPLDAPLVCAGVDGRRRVVSAADNAALTLGITPGLALAQAQARAPGLVIAPADPAADEAALDRLALWVLRRYSPLVGRDPPDGLLIDITGAAHRLGGEDGLCTDLCTRLRHAGITGRTAIADTIGAAHACARFSARTIPDLPITALRLDADLIIKLRRVGFNTVADLDATPRAPLARRFGPSPGQRLDQLLGRSPEPMQPIAPAEIIRIRHDFAEPIGTPDALAHATHALTEAICVALEPAGLGARRLDLVFHRVDASLVAIRIGTARPIRDAGRLAKLLLDRLPQLDPGFGVEAMTLAAPLAEPLAWRQANSLQPNQGHRGHDVSALIDTLTNRLGHDRLYRATPVESDIPERSVRRIPALAPATGATWPGYPRPTRLLARPEPVDTIALLPDQPPVQFTWRGKARRISRADGPERVFGEWWCYAAETSAVRDYFVVEDGGGARFWLFRSGDGEDATTGNLRWYLHGFFG